MALALAALTLTAGAQVKTDALKKAVDAAKEATTVEKKASKPATWIKLGEAYIAAYEAPFKTANGVVEIGWPQNFISGEKALSSDAVRVGNAVYTKDSYFNKDYYFDANGTLSFFEVTVPVYDDIDPLDEAVAAYVKAFSLDSKKAKDVSAALDKIAAKYQAQALSFYYLGKYAPASVAFEKAAEVSATAPLARTDTNSVYNAGYLAYLNQDYSRAKAFFEKSAGLSYFGEEGDMFARLADAEMNLGDSLSAKQHLEEGFSRYPSNQAIIVNLINLYIGNNEDPNKLFGLLDLAKENEPNNASLYYVEGNIRYNQLGQIDEALAAYRKCAEINPGYEFGYIGEGVMFYNLAADTQEKATEELDDAKYQTLVAQFSKYLKACIEPFENAFNTTADEEIKKTLAVYLKNAYYRFRDDDAKFAEGYDKYSAYSNR